MDEDEYKVGYGQPPREHRWKKGQSGNPRGRRRRNPPKSYDELVDNAFGEKFTIVHKGKTMRLSYLEVIVRNLRGQAAAGDLKALQALLGMRGLGMFAGAAAEVRPLRFTLKLEEDEPSPDRRDQATDNKRRA